MRMGDAVLVDYMLGILHDPWERVHMGITAENVAARYKISREMQDQLAVQSQQRAAAAIAAGRFKEQIVAVEVKTRKGVVLFDTDEHVRADITIDTLAKMKPAFKKDGLVTVGNASGISLGHPIGATGAIITTKAIAELHRIGGRYALVTMCIGGGQGIAAIFERV
jgi:acetyl-CoA C-acetyltransferase